MSGKVMVTKAVSKDGQEFDLLHYEPMTDEEIAFLKEFTGDEIRNYLIGSRFEKVPMEEVSYPFLCEECKQNQFIIAEDLPLFECPICGAGVEALINPEVKKYETS